MPKVKRKSIGRKPKSNPAGQVQLPSTENEQEPSQAPYQPEDDAVLGDENLQQSTSFEARMATLSGNERRTAQGFIDRSIEGDFEWPVQNESKDGSTARSQVTTSKVACY